MQIAPIFINFITGTMFEIIDKNLRIKQIKKAAIITKNMS